MPANKHLPRLAAGDPSSASDDRCVNLWAAVLNQALNDAAREAHGSYSNHCATQPTSFQKREAEAFLFSVDGDWARSREEIADRIGLDPDALRHGAARALREGACLPFHRRAARYVPPKPDGIDFAARAERVIAHVAAGLRPFQVAKREGMTTEAAASLIRKLRMQGRIRELA